MSRIQTNENELEEDDGSLDIEEEELPLWKEQQLEKEFLEEFDE